MKHRLATSLLLGVVLTVSVLFAIALAAGSNGVALADDDVSSPTVEIFDIVITGWPEPIVPINELIVATAAFTDPGASLVLAAVWDWGDGTSSECTSGSIPISTSDPVSCAIDKTNFLVQGSHVYTDPGVYAIGVLMTPDGDGDRSGQSVLEYLVVYDPDGGFVTGGGWIDSPAGAYTPDPSLSGVASFGFVSKYKKGADAPTGNTEFQFKAGDLNFHSDSYEWLVVNQNDSNAQFKGSGTINGAQAPNDEAYKFMLWAGDKDPDTFRIKIWWEEDGTEHAVYDNGVDQPISGGSIVIHKGKGK